MRHFTSVSDVGDLDALVNEALALKSDPYRFETLGKRRTLGLVFLNPSLRTRMSTQKAAQNLGLSVLSLNINQESWALEMQDGVIMDGQSVEHIRDAAAVFGTYCDLLGVRCFPTLQDRAFDYQETCFNKFIEFAQVPVLSLESATRHPLQSFADLITIREHWQNPGKPKVVLSWAPHIKALPQAVANSFAEWMLRDGADLVITHPPGFELKDEFTEGARIEYDQDRAIEGADFIYIKNWSAYTDYGTVKQDAGNWMLNPERLQAAPNARIMHCLPVRRNLEVPDALLDGQGSLILQQAENRVYAAQTILKRMLEAL